MQAIKIKLGNRLPISMQKSRREPGTGRCLQRGREAAAPSGGLVDGRDAEQEPEAPSRQPLPGPSKRPPEPTRSRGPPGRKQGSCLGPPQAPLAPTPSPTGTSTRPVRPLGTELLSSWRVAGRLPGSFCLSQGLTFDDVPNYFDGAPPHVQDLMDSLTDLGRKQQGRPVGTHSREPGRSSAAPHFGRKQQLELWS